MIRNRAYLRTTLLAVALLIASACGALEAPDPAATLQANRLAFETEATSIAQAAQAQATEISGTAVAAETIVAQGDLINQQLLLTLRAVIPPTQQIVNEGEVVTPGHVASPAPGGVVAAVTPGANPDAGQVSGDSSTLFTQVQTALTVRDSDGCADTLQDAFPADIGRIYITTRALNIRAGTVMRVQWTYEGDPAFTESFTVEQNDDDFCLWFFIEPTEIAFSPGNWTVQLFENERPIDPVVAFTIG